MSTAQEQATQNKGTKSTEKCTCSKRIVALEKQVADLRAEIALLRAVLQGGR